MTLSRSVEDYLKAIYTISTADRPAATSAIADALDVQPASVTGMVKRLAESGLVEHAPYRGVLLTETGSRQALQIIRRHRIIETYLYLRLGYSWDDVHAEAERLEHAASDDLIDRMADSLKNPSYDPHGSPIPTRSGEIEDKASTTLDTVPEGATVQIYQVVDEDPQRLRTMEAKGLLPGVDLLILSVPGDASDRIVCVGGEGGTEEEVSNELASRIFVGQGSVT